MNATRRPALRAVASLALGTMLCLGTGFVPQAKAGSLPGGNCNESPRSAVAQFLARANGFVAILDVLMP